MATTQTTSSSTAASTMAATSAGPTSADTTETTTTIGPTTGPADSTTGLSPIDVTCTQVIGYSQVNEWYNADGNFEATVDDGAYQLLWNGGAGVDQWQMDDYQGWDNELVSPCTTNADAPERVLLSVSGPFGDDEAAWAEAIEATLTQIRLRIPSVERIVLQPVVGGPDHATCQVGGQDVRASWQHAHIDNAIADVVGGSIVAGLSPEVETCEDYEDALGHLTDAGAATAGATIGDFYADW